MRKFDFKKWKNFRLQKVNLSEIDDKVLLINVYLTQVLTLLAGIGFISIQGRSIIEILAVPLEARPWVWGILLGSAVLIVDVLLTRWIPEYVTDDGGVNERLFGSRALWHIALLSFVVAVCEEVLFRGAVQHWLGPYWTSILFAVLHVRYLQHWVMTGLVFIISYGLGWVVTVTGTLWTAIIAHFMIDFVMGVLIRYRRVEPRDE